jgi:hypothetical protein
MIAVPVRSRRSQKAQFFQKLQHALPAFIVLGDGMAHLSHNPHGAELALGVGEVVAGVLVIGSVIRGFRQLRQDLATPADDVHVHHGVDWIDICLAGMLSVEAYAKYHATAHIPRPTIVLAVAMFAIGILHGRLAAWGDSRRQLRVTPDGISVPGRRPFSRLTLAWPEMASIEVGDRSAVIIAMDGRTARLDLTDVTQPTSIRDALMSARRFLDDARLPAVALAKVGHAASASIESTPSNS